MLCCRWIACPWESNFPHLCLGSISCERSAGRVNHFPGGCEAEFISVREEYSDVGGEGSGERRVVISHL